jgi:predicted Rossmann fold nucleotide-binding protein DprA/Smf involved in DNA uptake
VVGSRHVDDELIAYATDVGALVASAGRTLVSGGAKGVDQAAMRGALAAGGTSCGVLADSLEKSAMLREYRNWVVDGRLVLISPYDPGASFNVGHAMQRNKLIYALADAALVVNAEVDKGGTWAGATEQIDKFRLVPVYVRATGKESAGLDGLRKRGAMPWPNPPDAQALVATLATAALTPPVKPQAELELPAYDALPVEREAQVVREARPAVTAVETCPADTLFAAAREVLLQILTTPMKEVEVATALDVSKTQAKAWLNRLVDEGVVEKRRKPVGYIARQERLFE